MAGKEFREVRKRLGNEPADSSPYVGYARALLGELKEDMARNGLQQGVRRRSLSHEHGEVLIEVRSIFGQDQISIIVPTGGKEERVEEKEEVSVNPYLWVGYRRNNEASGESTPEWCVVVSEPGENGIVTDNPTWVHWGPHIGYMGPSEFSKEAQDAAWETSAQFSHVPANRRQYYIEERQGNIHLFTANLLRHYCVSYDPAPAEDAPVQLPYDPLAEEGDVGGRTFPSWWWEGERKWDRVTVLDPTQGAFEPTDRREADLSTVKILSEKLGLGGATGRVLPGEYAIKICGKGEDCRWSEGAPRWDSIWDNTDANSAWRTANFNEYYTGYYDPLVIDIEVRVMKYPNMITKNFQCTILNATYEYRNIWPFGDPYSEAVSSCPSGHDGSNRHHKNWWQDCILVDVNSGSIRLALNHAPDYMGSGGDSLVSCKRAKWKILVMLYPTYYPAGIDDWITTNIAEQIEYLVVRAATGLYGALSTPEQYATEIKAAISGKLAYGLAWYDVETMELTQLPEWDIGAADPNPDHDGVAEYTWGSFEDYYRIESLRAGQGIGLVAYGFGGPFYIGWHHTGDPDGLTCVPIDPGGCCDVP